MNDVEDERLTTAVPRLQRPRREDVLSTSGRLMPLRRDPTEPRVEGEGRVFARGSNVHLEQVPDDLPDDYESVSITRTEIVIHETSRRSRLALVLVLVLLAAGALAIAAWRAALTS